MAADPTPFPRPAASADGPVPAIGYIRVSMMREEAISPETQRASIEDWARRNGRRIVGWAEDLDMTGREFAKRKIGTLIERVKAGEAREIAVWKYSRFGRRRDGVAANLTLLEDAGGQLQSATEDVDARTATGKFQRDILFAVNAFESDRIGETWREVREYRVRNGLPPTGGDRFGYMRLGRIPDPNLPGVTRRDLSDPAGERYVPSPETGPVLAGIYERYLSGDGGRGISAWLNGLGHRTPAGKPWTARTVFRMLDSGFGAGYLRLHMTVCECGEPGTCKRREWLRGAHEPVIGEDMWQAYLERRALVRDEPPRSRRAVYPVSGITRCGPCSAAMVAGGSRNGDHAYLVCSRYLQSGSGACPSPTAVPVATVVAAVREELSRWAAELDARIELAAQRLVRHEAAEGAVKRLIRDLAAADRAVSRLLVQRAEDEDGRLDAAAWDQAVKDLREKRDRIGGALTAARAAEKASSADPIPVVAGIMEEWDTLPAAALRDALRALVRVTVWREDEGAPRPRGKGGRYLPRPSRIEVTPVWMDGQDETITIQDQ